MLYDENADVRKNAALSLIKVKSKGSIKELKKISLVEKDHNVINVINLAISNLNKI